MPRANSGQVVIVGGAIMGSFSAWALRKAGFAGSITVVEKDPTYQCSSTALSAASIRTQFGTPTNIQMSLYGAQIFRAIKAVFGSETDIGFHERGYLILGGADQVANARLRWLQARERELLPIRYVHLVFTLPRELAPLALQNKRVVYSLLFQASSATLLEIARDPRHLGAEIGFFSVLHTWNQRLQHHPHVHCVAAAGGLAPDHTHWIASRHSFFLPVKVLSRVFRGKFVAGLKTAFHQDKLEFYGHLAPLAEPQTFAAWLRSLFRHDWVVYAKPPFGGPEHALRYLSGYTHRVAISNRRLA